MRYLLQLAPNKFYVHSRMQTEFISQAHNFLTKDAAEQASLRIVGSRVLAVPVYGGTVYSTAPLVAHPDFSSHICGDVAAKARAMAAKAVIILALILFGAIAAQAQLQGPEQGSTGITARMTSIPPTPVTETLGEGTEADFQPNNSVLPLSVAVKRGLREYAELHDAVDLGEAARKFRAARRAAGLPVDSLLQ